MFGLLALLGQTDDLGGFEIDPSVFADPAASTGVETPEVVWSLMAPILILGVGAILGLIVMSLFAKRLPRLVTTLYTVVVAGASLASVYPLWNRVSNPLEGPQSAVKGAIGIDHFSLFVMGLIAVAIILTALLADDYLDREGIVGSEFFVLLLLAGLGGSVMAAANDLIVLFIGLEIISISAYVMAAIHGARMSSLEAGFKYFVPGAFSSAVLLYGIALVYGSVGSTNLLKIQAFLSESFLTDNGMLLAGLALMTVGFGFKVAAAPFHMWTPDVYQGAPSPVTAFMASGVKIAGFAGFLRVFVTGFEAYQDEWRPMVYGLAILSLVVGSVMAVVQTNVKRMLAYSSIAHAGFILVGLEVATPEGTSAMLFYLAAYLFMAIGSFTVITIVGRTGDGRHSLEDYHGLGRAHPVVALLFTVFLLAQAGTPFTVGFLAKLGVLAAAVDQEHWPLAVVAMLSAVVSAFLYLRIITAMYFAGAGDDGEEPAVFAGPPLRIRWTTTLVLVIALLGTVGLGVAPDLLSDITDDAVPALVEVAPASTGGAFDLGAP